MLFTRHLVFPRRCEPTGTAVAILSNCQTASSNPGCPPHPRTRCFFLPDLDTHTDADVLALHSVGSDPKISNCTFFNSSFEGNLAVSCMLSSPSITNSIFWGNETRDIIKDLSSSVTVTHSLLTTLSEYSDPSNFTEDPLFVGPASGDVRLQKGSPCIDRADGDAAPEFDIDGQARFDDPGIEDLGTGEPTYADIGAFEYIPQ